MTEEREEFAVFWIDDDDEPVVIYPEYSEAQAVADFGQGLVIRRVVTVTTTIDWEPCPERNSEGTGTLRS